MIQGVRHTDSYQNPKPLFYSVKRRLPRESQPWYSPMRNSVQALVDDSPMSSSQIITVLLCVILNMMDGVDILLTAFTAAELMKEWSLTNSSLGILLSAGLFGMAAGAMLLAPMGDKWGRRTTIIVSLVIIGVCVVASSYATNYLQFAGWRFFTGVGVGGMIANISTISAEFSSLKRRDFSVSLVLSGNPVGGVLGGIATVYLIAHYDWRTAFFVAGCCSLLLLPLIFWKLPESVVYLVSARPGNALEKINKILNQMNHRPITALPNIETKSNSCEKQSVLSSLFDKGNIANTLYLWIAFFTIMFSFYFIMSWTPKLLVQAGMSLSEGISGSIVLNFGGIIGAPVLGFFAAKYKLQNLIMLYTVSTSILMVCFGLITDSFAPALFVALFLGFFLFGSIIGVYTITPYVYKVKQRATGLGYAMAVGRLGAVLAPYMAGFLLDASLSVTVLYTLFALPMLCVAIVSIVLE